MRYLLPRLRRDTTVRLIRTLPEAIVVADPQERAGDVLARLPRDLRILPVVERGELRGVLFRRDIRRDDPRSVKEVMHDAERYCIARSTPIADALDRFREGRPMIVLHRRSVDGIVTLADLNRRAFRVLLYAHLAELEGRLADALRAWEPDPGRCFARIRSAMSPDAIARWESEVDAGVEVHPAEALDLSDIVRVYRRIDDIRALLGPIGRKRLARDLGSLVDLRQVVMHPVRPLVRTPKDVDRLIGRLERLQHYWELTDRYGVPRRRRPFSLTPRRTRGSPRRPRPRS